MVGALIGKGELLVWNGLVLWVVVGEDVDVEYDDVLQVQEGVLGHPEGRRGVGAGGFSLGVPETLAGGEKGLVYK